MAAAELALAVEKHVLESGSIDTVGTVGKFFFALDYVAKSNFFSPITMGSCISFFNLGKLQMIPPLPLFLLMRYFGAASWSNQQHSKQSTHRDWYAPNDNLLQKKGKKKSFMFDC